MPKKQKNLSNKKGKKWLIGIDEAGRGPLAGPVAVGVVLMAARFKMSSLRGIKDSKKLSAEARKMWFAKLKQWQQQGLVRYHVALVNARVIDRQGISLAIRRAIKISLEKVCKEKAGEATNTISPGDCWIRLDGSLRAPAEFLFQETIIKGDEIVPIISLASIAAKVTRDKKMVGYAKKFPHYGFERHMGYGTAVHRHTIKQFGPSEIHRRSYLRNIISDKVKP